MRTLVPSASVPGPPRGRGPRAGFTLLELLVLLALLSVLVGATAPAMEDLRDRMAVRGAREAAAGLLARARLQALLEGGSEVLAREAPPGLVLRSDGGAAAVLDLNARYGVDLEIPGPARRVVLRFDALGIGRMASRTLRFRRRDAEAALSVSSYGRVRRR